MNGRFELLPFPVGVERVSSFSHRISWTGWANWTVEEPWSQSRKLHVWSETPHGGDRVS